MRKGKLFMTFAVLGTAILMAACGSAKSTDAADEKAEPEIMESSSASSIEDTEPVSEQESSETSVETSASTENVDEPAEEAPEYFSEYQVPAELGNDYESSLFELDGVLYQLPCALSAFTENGWEIEETTKDIFDAGEQEASAAQIGKDGRHILIGLYNFSDKKKEYAQNCAVFQVVFDSGNLADVADDFIKMPGGLNWGSKEEDVTKCEPAGVFKSEEAATYFWPDIESDASASVHYQFGSDGTHSITVYNDEWNY